MTKQQKIASKDQRRFPIASVLSLLAALLSGCDGGIFGTGDGNEPMVEASGNETPPTATSDASLSPESPTETTAPAEQPEGVADVNGNGSLSFSNSSITTTRSDALLRFVHADASEQDNIVVTLNNQLDTPLLPLPGLSYLDGADQYRAIPANNAHAVRIFLAEEFRANAAPKVAVAPLDVAAGTITTFIVRQIGATTVADRLLPLVTQSNLASGESAVRLLHVARSFAVVGPIDVYLHEATTAVATLTPTVANLSYDITDQDYVSLEAGSYQLSITLAGNKSVIYSAPELIDLNATQLLTLLIRDDSVSTEGVAILPLDDSAEVP